MVSNYMETLIEHPDMMLYRIETVEFRREKDTPWEFGLLLAEGNIGVMDMTGKIVNVFDWRRLSPFALDLSSLYKVWCETNVVEGTL